MFLTPLTNVLPVILTGSRDEREKGRGRKREEREGGAEKINDQWLL